MVRLTRKINLSLLILLALPLKISAQFNQFDRSKDLNNFYARTTVILTAMQDGLEQDQGTGFWYSPDADAKHTFLITCRHLVSDETRLGYHPTQLSLTAIANSPLAHGPQPIIINLYSSSAGGLLDLPLWRELDPFVDVIAIPIDPHFIVSGNWVIFTSDDLLPDSVDIALGSDVLIFGYPSGFFDKKAILPIGKRGSVASVFGAAFEDQPLFLVDAKLEKGMSGGPVVTKNEGFTIQRNVGSKPVGERQTFLIGINSGFYGEANTLDLDAVWYADILRKLTSIWPGS